MPIITETELADHLKIDDRVDENSLSQAAAAACRQVHRWCGRTFDKSTVSQARMFRPVNGGVCYIDDIYDSTGLVVEADYSLNGTYTTTWTLGIDFSLDPPDGRMNGEVWPYYRLVAGSNWSGWSAFGVNWGADRYGTRRPIRVTTTKWGWADYPDDVMLATLIQASRLYKRRTSPEGVLGGFQDYGAVRVSTRMDPDVQDLLAPYRRLGGLA